MPPIITFVLTAIAIVSAVFGVIQAFRSPKPARVSFGYQDDTGGSPRYGTFGPLDNTISNDLAVPVLYGRLKLAGNIIWQSEGGSEVAKIVGLCEGEVACIDQIKANDLLIEHGEEAPGCSASKYLGTTEQTTDSRVPATTDAGVALAVNMNLHNLAYVAVTLVASDQLNGGSPTITSVVNGLLVKTWDGTAWSSDKKFSRNPAAIIRDFLTNERYGLGIPEANLDDESFGEVYNYCHEVIAD